MKNQIVFVSEVEIKNGQTTQDLIKVRFKEKFDGYRQTEDGDFDVARIDTVLMYRSTFLAQIFESLPLLSLSYSRTESFQCIKAMLLNADCELERALVTDEDADHSRYQTTIKNIVVDDIRQKVLEEELFLAFK